MAQDFAIGTQASRRTPRLTTVVAQLWRRLTTEMFNSYHPERHYMRGPGPKWHAKQGYTGGSDQLRA